MKITNFSVEEWLNKWEKKVVHDIARSSIKALILDELVSLGGTSISELFGKHKNESLDYDWTEGSDAFRQEVASLYQAVSSENISQTNGVTGAGLLALYVSVETGDHVVPMSPTYQQLYDIPKSLGTAVDSVRLKEEEDWQSDLEQLEALVKPETKIICLDSANNPISISLDWKTLERIVEIVRIVDTYVLVDEVYAPLTDKGELLPIVDVYEKGIAANSLSETCSTPGIRIGWTATGPELAEVFRKYRDYTMTCGGVLSDDFAVHVSKDKEKILERNKKIITGSLVILKQWVANEPKIELIVPSYVSTSFIRLAIKEDDQIFCISLLEETEVLLVPGSIFGSPKYVQLGYCYKKETLEKRLFLLSEFLRKQA